MPGTALTQLSMKEMFLNADPTVQAVMFLLLAASVVSWLVILEKAALLRRAGRAVRLFREATESEGPTRGPAETSGLAGLIRAAGLRAAQDAAGRESRADYRERVERAMRLALSARLTRLEARTLLLATVGSTAPFVGLFGTVWGIMHSFSDIAASGDTSLAAVAPGIAEALSATAMGLAAALPAVIAFNMIGGALKRIGQEGQVGIALWGDRLARAHFETLEN